MAIRIGVLGAARISPKAVVFPAQKIPEIEIAAVAARSVERAEQFAHRHNIPTVHTGYDDLINDPTLDVIYNPLPNHLHGAWTVAALRAGKHVLCEKPFAANAEEAQAIAKTAAETGRVVMEAFHYRYHPVFIRALEIIAQGELGPLQRLEADFCTPLLRPRDIRYRYDLAGGALMDLGCYTVHMLRTLAGDEPTVVDARARCFTPSVDRRMDAELVFNASPHSRAGATVTARTSCSLFSSTLLRVMLVAQCEHGELRLLNPVLPHLFHRLRVRVGSEWRTERFSGPTTYAHQMRVFVQALQTGTPPPTDAHDGTANMRVLDAIYRRAGLPLRRPAVPNTTTRHETHS